MQNCLIEYCTEPARSRGLCEHHYGAFRYNKTIDRFERKLEKLVVPRTHPIHGVWKSVKERCNKPEHASYKHYGAKGINYDPRWESFNEFYQDMHEGYKASLWIDRIDNNKPYCKENCRWVTPSQSAQNRSSTILTEQAVIEIKSQHKLVKTKMSTFKRTMALKYGVSVRTIGDVINGTSWGNIS